MTIFFDVDGTLLDDGAAERRGAIAVLGAFRHVFPHAAAESFADEWQRLAERYIASYAAGRMSVEEQTRERMRELFSQAWVSLTDSEADIVYERYLAHSEESWRTFPDVVRCLKALKHHTLGIITNGAREQVCRKLEVAGIAQFFAHVIISSDVGAAKPQPAIFHEACRRAGCDAEVSLYVGDRFEFDAVASRAAGLHGVWLNRSGSGARSSEIPTLASLGELPAYLELIRWGIAPTAAETWRPDSSCGISVDQPDTLAARSHAGV
jgi:putative hydrolase of the HAD superfamily